MGDILIAPTDGQPPSTLADADPGDLIRVRLTLFEFVSHSCWGIDLQPGEVLQCLDQEDGQVLVARRDGSRLTIDADCARFVAVEPFQGPLSTDEPEEPFGPSLTDFRPGG